MLADLGLQVEQFQEILQDVTIARNQATYLDFVKDDKTMKKGYPCGTTNMMANIDTQV